MPDDYPTLFDECVNGETDDAEYIESDN